MQGVCSEAASFDLTGAKLGTAIQEVMTAVEIALVRRDSEGQTHGPQVCLQDESSDILKSAPRLLHPLMLSPLAGLMCTHYDRLAALLDVLATRAHTSDHMLYNTHVIVSTLTRV